MLRSTEWYMDGKLLTKLIHRWSTVPSTKIAQLKHIIVRRGINPPDGGILANPPDRDYSQFKSKIAPLPTPGGGC